MANAFDSTFRCWTECVALSRRKNSRINETQFITTVWEESERISIFDITNLINFFFCFWFGSFAFVQGFLVRLRKKSIYPFATNQDIHWTAHTQLMNVWTCAHLLFLSMLCLVQKGSPAIAWNSFDRIYPLFTCFRFLSIASNRQHDLFFSLFFSLALFILLYSSNFLVICVFVVFAFDLLI